MHVAVVQLDIIWEDKPANHGLVEEMLGERSLPPGSLVLLPELGDTGFSFHLDAIIDDRSLRWAAGLARASGVWVQMGHAERGDDGRGRNCATLVAPDGSVAGTYRKVHPFSYGREIEHFGGGDELLVVECGALLVAPLICYDLRFPELWRHAVQAGASVFTIGASWPAARQEHWRALLIARAIENQAYVVACNRTGDDPHLHYAGGSVIIDPRGRVVAEAGDAPCLLEAELDPAVVATWRREFPALSDIRKELLGTFPLRAPIRTSLRGADAGDVS